MNHLSTILLAASRHASKDTTRPHLASVRLSWSAGAWLAIATDGHTLIAASSDVDGKPFEALYNAKMIAKGCKLAKAKDGYCVREPGSVLAFSDGAGSVLRVEQRTDCPAFPPVAQVIPRRVEDELSVHLVNATYLAEHAETHALLGNPKTNATGIIPAKHRLDPMMLLTDSSQGLRCLSVIMPMRLWESNADPERIRAYFAGRVGSPVASLESEAAE